MGWRTDHRYNRAQRAEAYALVSTWPRWKRLAWRARNAAVVLAAVAVLGFVILTVVRPRAAEVVHGAGVSFAAGDSAAIWLCAGDDCA